MKTVLIVDDSQFMRNWLKSILAELSFTVVAEAENGLEAIKQYKEYYPDVIIMDIMMPVMDGIKALKEILRINPCAKVIMCSSIGTKYHIIEALQIGAKDFVVKPYFHNLPLILKNILLSAS